jgi:hypothetical protein
MHPKLIITCSSGIAVQAPSLMRVLLGRVSWADSLTTGFFCVGALGFVRCAFLCLLTLLALRGQSGTDMGAALHPFFGGCAPSSSAGAHVLLVLVVGRLGLGLGRLREPRHRRPQLRHGGCGCGCDRCLEVLPRRVQVRNQPSPSAFAFTLQKTRCERAVLRVTRECIRRRLSRISNEVLGICEHS